MPGFQVVRCDDETGEVTFHNVNMETGEPLVDCCRPLSAPQRYQQPTVPLADPNSFMFPKRPRNKKFQRLKDKIISGSGEVSYRMILLICVPISVMFPSLVAMLLVLFEIFAHVRCHKYNKALKLKANDTIYYRSPFHAVTGVYCASCRESASACKVGQLQDQRRYRYDYLKGLGI